MPKKKKRKKGRHKNLIESLTSRNKNLGQISAGKGFGSNVGVIGNWKAGDPIPTHKLTKKEMQYIGKKRHEAALKKYKRKKRKK